MQKLQQLVVDAESKAAITAAAHKAEVAKWQGKVESTQAALAASRARVEQAGALLTEKNATVQRLTAELRRMQQRQALQAVAIAELTGDEAAPTAARCVARAQQASLIRMCCALSRHTSRHTPCHRPVTSTADAPRHTAAGAPSRAPRAVAPLARPHSGRTTVVLQPTSCTKPACCCKSVT